jgi:hypothetical protein
MVGAQVEQAVDAAGVTVNGRVRGAQRRRRPAERQRVRAFLLERQAVARAIAAPRLTPVMFELGARPHPPRDLYRAYLAQSDIFVGLYWQRYEQVRPGMQVSGLEEELQLARAGGLPRLLYVKTPAPDREPRLAELLDRVKRDASDSYRYFRTPLSWAGWCATTSRRC